MVVVLRLNGATMRYLGDVAGALAIVGSLAAFVSYCWFRDRVAARRAVVVACAVLMLMTADKKPMALGFKPSKALGKEFSIPLPNLPAGSYVLSWKSMAKDGHAMPGAVRFTVTGQ